LTGNKYFIYPSNSISECAAIRNKNSCAISAQCDVYKCWEIVGNEDYKVGELTDKGIQITNPILLNRYLYGADPFEDEECKDCFSFPICGGGCPHKRIENKFNKQNFNLCSRFRDNFEEYLLLRSQKMNNI
jgi:uncharacterized protein